ncbi:uncharacterized protein PV07_00677 [Cladophialophora immunda]|uniref:F-box domain-containing protein n=1 Tax=Cladophialophora immunda TaxID=569365 RepID=A0A0D2A095_9EURO|nr:uncharacterized protein PV07_00677 [Cladophialophora immunda]KIW33861.1 hypothetical protein PV07_00677 [Cladophialophora immunda]
MARRFPAELLRLVLHHLKVDLYANSSNALLKTLRVCRLWRDMGYQVLYTDISMTAFQLATFAKSSPIGQTLTRTLSITIPCNDPVRSTPYPNDFDIPDSIALKYTEYMQKAIRSIPRIVQGMLRLESFSVVVPTRPPKNWTLSKAVQRAIPEILQALPDSLKHLEIDAVGSSSFRRCMPFTPHYCPFLRERMSSLSNLRLRVPALCRGLFRRSHLEHRDEPEPSPGEGAMQCTILINTMGSDSDIIDHTLYFRRMVNGFRSNGTVERLAEDAQAAIAKGRCPTPERLSFFTRYRGNKEGPLFSAINELVLAPVVRTLRSPFREIRDRTGIFLRYREPDGSMGEAWGTWNCLMDTAEGSVWTETVEGYRLPSIYLKQHSRFDGSVVKRTSLLKKKQVGPRAHGALFAKEQAEGRQLLRVQEIQGLEVGDVKRDPTSKEVAKAIEAGIKNPESEWTNWEDPDDVALLTSEDEGSDDAASTGSWRWD